jgi:phosphonate transport system permease protein
MLRTSLFFVVIAGAAFVAADISITTFDPWLELRQMGIGLLTPDFFSLPGFGRALFNTVSFALIGLSGAVFFGTILSFFFEYTAVRLFAAFIRAVHELFWAFLLMPIIGLNSLCGILAIAIPYAGVFAKVYAEIRQEADQQPFQALSGRASRLSGFIYGTLPLIYQDLKNYTSYRFECALRSSAILGFIGLPTLGYHLETAFREGMYSEAAALLYCFYLLVISLRLWARPKFILVPLLLAVIFTSWQTSVSLSNILRFFTYDILPWPMRADGFYDGTQTVSLVVMPLFSWVKDVFLTGALPGIWNTLVLTQIALACTAIFTLAAFPPASRVFFPQGLRG